MNKKLKPQIENASDIIKRAIFKEIIKLTFLKRFTVVPLSP
jgi:hypothetical protein